jgi:hypothetical protein
METIILAITIVIIPIIMKENIEIEIKELKVKIK